MPRATEFTDEQCNTDLSLCSFIIVIGPYMQYTALQQPSLSVQIGVSCFNLIACSAASFVCYHTVTESCDNTLRAQSELHHGLISPAITPMRTASAINRNNNINSGGNAPSSITMSRNSPHN